MLFVRDQRRWGIRRIMLHSGPIRKHALATPRFRIGRGWLAQIPLTDFPIFGTCQEQIGRRFGDDALHAIRMTAVNPGIGVRLGEITRIGEEVVESLTPRRGGEARGRLDIAIAAGVFNIENSHLVIARAGDHRSIVGMRHKFDREDVRAVAGGNGGVQGEWGRGRFGLVGVDIQV